jgi:hypothetical protein
VLLAVAGSTPSASPQAAQPAPNTTGLVAQGEYLANRVAMCVQCHSPRDAEGNVILTERFHGGAIPVLSPYPNRQFASQAPNIAGLPGHGSDPAASADAAVPDVAAGCASHRRVSPDVLIERRFAQIGVGSCSAKARSDPDLCKSPLDERRE